MKREFIDFVHWFIFVFIGFTVLLVINGVELYDKDHRTILGNSGSYRVDDNLPNTVLDDETGKSSDKPTRVRIFPLLTLHGSARGMIREVSAYNSVPDQTDGSPCISADGTDICRRHKNGECIVATNAYPLKTRLRIDKIGDCTVADRTHERHADRVDLFMDKDIEGALNFGVQKLTIIEIQDHT